MGSEDKKTAIRFRIFNEHGDTVCEINDIADLLSKQEKQQERIENLESELELLRRKIHAD